MAGFNASQCRVPSRSRSQRHRMSVEGTVVVWSWFCFVHAKTMTDSRQGLDMISLIGGFCSQSQGLLPLIAIGITWVSLSSCHYVVFLVFVCASVGHSLQSRGWSSIFFHYRPCTAWYLRSTWIDPSLLHERSLDEQIRHTSWNIPRSTLF